jgi:hypothetical protein
MSVEINIVNVQITYLFITTHSSCFQKLLNEKPSLGYRIEKPSSCPSES